MKKHFANKETQILLHCTRTSISSAQETTLKKLLHDGVDWESLIEKATKHRLVNFLYPIFNTYFNHLIPEQTLISLKNHYTQNCTKSLVLSARLIQILELFKANQIDAVPFKGLVLAKQIYGDSGLRSFVDLDILVRKKDAIKARDLLIANGLIVDVKIPNTQVKKYLKKENFFQLYNDKGTLNIDLHWEITGRYSLQPIFFEDLENQFGTIDISGTSIPTLSIEDTLLYLCIHGTSHCWEHIEMIGSVSQIISSEMINDWEALIEKSTQLKCKRMLLLGVALSKLLFDIDLPQIVQKAIQNDKTIQSLSKKIIFQISDQSLQAYTESLSWRFSPVHFKIRDTFFDSIKYGLRLFFQPTVREWEQYPLPSYLLFLYYFLRPYRLIKEGFKRQHA